VQRNRALGRHAFALPRLDAADGFVAVAAVFWGVVPEERADGGTDTVAIEERGTDIAALVDALRLPDARSTGGMCDLSRVLPPWLALVDAGGRWVRPGVPFDTCGKPRIEVAGGGPAGGVERAQPRPYAWLRHAGASDLGTDPAL
jgi:hypothetical protein